MRTASPTLEANVVRRVFPHWAVTIPATTEETFVAPDGYWHAWDRHRSVSLTSNVITDRQGRRISPRQVLKMMPPQHGDRVRMPPGLDGWAVVISQPQPARASPAISGIIARKGGILIATVTSETSSGQRPSGDPSSCTSKRRVAPYDRGRLWSTVWRSR